jgi:hypothetical protein
MMRSIFASVSPYQIMDEIRRGDSERAALQAFQRDARDELGDACYARAYEGDRDRVGRCRHESAGAAFLHLP